MAATQLMMAQSSGNNKITTSPNNAAEVEPKSSSSSTFHDFMGMTCPPNGGGAAAADVGLRFSKSSPSAAASSARGPFSFASDLASERQMGSHFEGVPFYGPRSDVSGPESSNRLTRSKRSHSDSAFMGSYKEGIPQIGHESSESSHWMKTMRHGTGGERPKMSNEDDVVFGIQSIRPTSASLILQPQTGPRVDANFPKWDRATPMNVGPPKVPYSPRAGPPSMHQVHPSRFKGSNPGPSVISQAAADEGSRTGIKGSGLFSSMNTNSGVSEKSSPGVANGSRSLPGVHISEPDSSQMPSQHGANRQMTIFYGGQAHVFDDVHPNKADVIMALAGTNGGSWSTTYSPKSRMRQVKECYKPIGENEIGTPSSMAFLRECSGKSPVIGNSAHVFSSGDRIFTPPGIHRASFAAKDSSNAPREADSGAEGKRDT